MSLLFIIFLYIIHSSANSRKLGSVFLQISSTQPRNNSGHNTLPCGIPDIALTSSDSCLSTLTLCEGAKRFESSSIIGYFRAPSSCESAINWQSIINWISHEYTFLKQFWTSYNHPPISQTCLKYSAITRSIFSKPLILSWTVFFSN